MRRLRKPRVPRITGGAAIGIVGLLAALAVVFGNASGTETAARDALNAQRLEATLGSLAAYRTTLGQTLLVAEASPESAAIPILIEDSELLVSQLSERFDAASAAFDAAGLDIAIDPSATLAASRAMLDSLTAGDTAAAGQQAERLAAEIDSLTAELLAPRDALLSSLSAAGLQAGRVATAARFMVAFGIPGTALLSWGAFARKRRKRQKLQTALEYEREVNRSKDQLIANISHELRTPLTGIYAAARTLTRTDDAGPDLSRELTGIILEQSIDLTRMVEDLLVSAQAGAQRLSLAVQVVDVEGSVTSVIDELGRTGIVVDSTCSPGTVAADPLRLRQILRNLVSNAHKHGGDRIWIEGAPSEHGYLISVIDDGDGIPSEIEERLFTPFVHQGDRPLITGSVGLGLSITRILAEAMGGSVEYVRDESATRFLVDLPSPPRDPAPEAPPEIVDEPKREPITTD